MATLKFNPDWSEDEQVMLSEKLDLTEQQETRLFQKHKPITLSDDQANAYMEMLSEDAENDDDETNDDDDNTHDRNADETASPNKVDVSEETPSDVVMRRSFEQEAAVIGESFTPVVAKLIDEGFAARQRVNVAPLLLAEELIKEKTKQTILGWREPGTDAQSKDKSKHPHGNNGTDWHHYKPSGEKRTIREGFYNIMYASMARGKELVKQLQAAEAAVASFKDNGPARPVQFKGMKRSECKAEVTLLKSQVNSGASQLRAAVKFVWQQAAIDSLSMVGYVMDRKSDGTIRNGNDPIRIYDYERNAKGEKVPVEAENISINTFNRYNVPKAIEAAGGADKVTVEHLESTIKRDKKEDAKSSGQDDWSKTEITTVNQFENIVASLASYLGNADDETIKGKRVAAITKQLGTDGAFLLSFGDVATAIDELWTTFEKAYRTAANQRAVAEAAKRASKKAA